MWTKKSACPDGGEGADGHSRSLDLRFPVFLLSETVGVFFPAFTTRLAIPFSRSNLDCAIRTFPGTRPQSGNPAVHPKINICRFFKFPGFRWICFYPLLTIPRGNTAVSNSSAFPCAQQIF